MKIKEFVKKYVDPKYLLILYFAALVIITFTGFRSLSPDNIFILLFGLALLTKKARQYLKDWLPFVLLILGYEALRGVADNLNQYVHIQELIDLERTIFGTIPTLRLQELLHVAGQIRWFDYLGLFLYCTHFFFSFLVAYFLWLKKRAAFKMFVRGFLILCFAGFLTYIIYPAMPPWLAAREGYLPEVHRILLDTAKSFPYGLKFTTVYKIFGANPIAAMPSLHSAWPLFAFLMLFRFYKHKAWPFFLIPAGVWFFIVYFGEHYIIDVIAGIIYALAAFWLAAFWAKNKKDKQKVKKPTL
ncbi:MAG: phosphatase PAP2 family protein [Patescibacteria group bacterium]